MQTNLTALDAAYALALGILGSLVAAYLFQKTPAWLIGLSTLWAERSRASAKRKLGKLLLQLAEAHEMKADVACYIGGLFRRLGFAVAFFSICVMALVAASGFRILDGLYSLGASESKGVIASTLSERTLAWLPALEAVFVVVLISMALSLKFLSEVVRMSHLEDYISSIEMRIKRLRIRVRS